MFISGESISNIAYNLQLKHRYFNRNSSYLYTLPDLIGFTMIKETKYNKDKERIAENTVNIEKKLL